MTVISPTSLNQFFQFFIISMNYNVTAMKFSFKLLYANKCFPKKKKVF